jgi:hypothetical protein
VEEKLHHDRSMSKGEDKKADQTTTTMKQEAKTPRKQEDPSTAVVATLKSSPHRTIRSARMPLLSLPQSKMTRHTALSLVVSAFRSQVQNRFAVYSCPFSQHSIVSVIAAEPTATTQIDRARTHCSRMKGLNSAEAPLTECPPNSDHKSRFFWRIGPPPADNAHRDLNMPPVIPKNFPHWADTMNGWGEKILGQSLRDHRCTHHTSCFKHVSSLPRLLPLFPSSTHCILTMIYS